MRKVIIPISVFLLIIGLFLIFRKEDGVIHLTVDHNQVSADNFNKSLLNIFVSQRDYDGNLSIYEGENYLSYLKDEFKSEREDSVLHYATFSSQILHIVESNKGVVLDNISKDIPEVFNSLGDVNGDSYYTPVTWSPWGIYYNKSIFSEFNLKEPTTLTELYSLADRLLSEGYTPFSMLERIRWPLAIWFDYISLRKFGAEFNRSLYNGNINFNDAKVVEIYTELFDLIDAGYFMTNNQSVNWLDMLNDIESRDSVMVLGGAFIYDNAPESLKSELGWFPFPVIDPSMEYDEIVSSSGYIVSGSENIPLTKKFLKNTLSISGQKIIRDESKLYPLHPEVIESMDRVDLKEAYDHISGSRVLTPSIERNSGIEYLQQLKLSINMLLRFEQRDEITSILQQLEQHRTR